MYVYLSTGACLDVSGAHVADFVHNVDARVHKETHPNKLHAACMHAHGDGQHTCKYPYGGVVPGDEAILSCALVKDSLELAATLVTRLLRRLDEILRIQVHLYTCVCMYK